MDVKQVTITDKGQAWLAMPASEAFPSRAALKAVAAQWQGSHATPNSVETLVRDMTSHAKPPAVWHMRSYARAWVKGLIAKGLLAKA